MDRTHKRNGGTDKEHTRMGRHGALSSDGSGPRFHGALSGDGFGLRIHGALSGGGISLSQGTPGSHGQPGLDSTMPSNQGAGLSTHSTRPSLHGTPPPTNGARPRLNGKELAFKITLGLLCTFIFLIIVYPLYFIVIASFSDSTLVATGKVWLFPKNISFFGYQEIFKDMRIWTGYRNTVFYTLFGTLVNMLFTLPAAYVLSRREFRARKVIMFIFVVTMFFNGGLIPTYLLMKDLHLTNTIWVFIIPFCVNVFYLIIARTFFESSLPQELYEAAVMDGCSHFIFFFKVALPLSKAMISVIGLYYLVGHWNDFFTALIYIRNNNLQPLQIILRDILLSNQVFAGGAGTGGDAGGYAQRYADQIKYGVIIVSTLPILVIYPFIQKYFEKGVMIGSIKG